jgi:hypothetical protein
VIRFPSFVYFCNFAALTPLFVCPGFAQSASVSPATRDAVRQLVGDIMVLNQGVATTAVTAYAIADSAQPFAPHDTPAQVEQMLKEAKQYENYQFFKNAGVFP